MKKVPTIQAFILAGGLGTRLGSLLSDQPKPMAPVAGRPFLEYLLLYLKKYQVTDVVICSSYRHQVIKEYVGNGARWGLQVCYSREGQPMGTGGALRLAETLLQTDEFLVMNGDSFFGIDLELLIGYHQKKEALGTLALAQVDNTERYGTVEVDHDGRIVRFLEKTKGVGAGLVNGGIYVFRRDVLKLIPDGRPISLEHEIFPKLIGKGFYGLPFDGYFIDIGVPEDYLKLQADPSRLLAAVGLKNKEV